MVGWRFPDGPYRPGYADLGLALEEPIVEGGTRALIPGRRGTRQLIPGRRGISDAAVVLLVPKREPWPLIVAYRSNLGGGALILEGDEPGEDDLGRLREVTFFLVEGMFS